ncbi:pectin lyase fold/virulence factor [Paraphoma chrysanthemicola]|nr:pectin lyase fold/virulence factor [Paraphoma chrysanthemicola]
MVRFSPFVALLSSLSLFLQISAVPLLSRDQSVSAPLVRKASQQDIEHARELIRDTLISLSVPSEARSQSSLELRAAAALVAEAEAAATSTPFVAKRANPYWMENIEHKGSFPRAWGGNSAYRVFRNVKDYGAVGDGVTDDTEAIQYAISEGGRNTGVKPAVVYFPQGKYLISASLDVYTNTQVIGDTNTLPELQIAPSFVDDVVFNTVGAQWFGHFRAIQINMDNGNDESILTGIRWRGGEGSSAHRVVFWGKSGTNVKRGIQFDNATGGVFSGGWYKDLGLGVYGSISNGLFRSLSFAGCKTAAHITSGIENVFANNYVVDSDTAYRLHSENGGPNPSSFTLLDTLLQNVGTGVLLGPLNKTPGNDTPGVSLENLGLRFVDRTVADTFGTTLVPNPTRTGSLRHWAVGPVYKNGERTCFSGNTSEYSRESTLLGGGGQAGPPLDTYNGRTYPDFESATVDQFVHIRDYGAKGDGTTDDTKAVQSAFDATADGSKYLYVDAGVYLVSDTIIVPVKARVTGEALATIVGTGDQFSQVDSAKAILRVGNAGDVGGYDQALHYPSLSGLTITTKGNTAGAVGIEWNVQGGDLTNVHIKIGGSDGSLQTATQCPATISDADRAKCRVAAALLRITPSGSGYFESIVLSTAETDFQNKAVALYTARGLLVESQEATWLYAITAKNSVLYQYNINRARNVAGLALTAKTPAFQPTPAAPAPFATQVGRFAGDPSYSCGGDFDGCDSAWAGVVRDSQQVFLSGVVSYASYANVDEACVDGYSCQKALWSLAGNKANVRLQQFATVGAQYNLVSDGKGVKASDNWVNASGRKWSQITIFDAVATA